MLSALEPFYSKWFCLPSFQVRYRAAVLVTSSSLGYLVLPHINRVNALIIQHPTPDTNSDSIAE